MKISKITIVIDWTKQWSEIKMVNFQILDTDFNDYPYFTRKNVFVTWFIFNESLHFIIFYSL